jgi:hypothetical protein
MDQIVPFFRGLLKVSSKASDLDVIYAIADSIKKLKHFLSPELRKDLKKLWKVSGEEQIVLLSRYMMEVTNQPFQEIYKAVHGELPEGVEEVGTGQVR